MARTRSAMDYIQSALSSLSSLEQSSVSSDTITDRLSGNYQPSGSKIFDAGGSSSENGRLSLDQLVEVEPGFYLEPRTASSFKQLESMIGQPISLKDAYRSYDDQVAIANEKGIYGQGGWAAVPGTSNHGLGIAVDVSEDSIPFFQKYGPSLGWTQPMADEPWHWEMKS